MIRAPVQQAHMHFMVFRHRDGQKPARDEALDVCVQQDKPDT